MAEIKNIEGNVKIEICLIRNEMFDYDSQRSDFENWIPFVLSITLPNRCSKIDEDAKAVMTVYELKNLIHGFEKIMRYLENRENYNYNYRNSESYFEINLESVIEDNVLEMELWINVGNQTKGKFYGFDEGIRIVIKKDDLVAFINDLRTSFDDAIGLPLCR